MASQSWEGSGCARPRHGATAQGERLAENGERFSENGERFWRNGEHFLAGRDEGGWVEACEGSVKVPAGEEWAEAPCFQGFSARA